MADTNCNNRGYWNPGFNRCECHNNFDGKHCEKCVPGLSLVDNKCVIDYGTCSYSHQHGLPTDCQLLRDNCSRKNNFLPDLHPVQSWDWNRYTCNCRCEGEGKGKDVPRGCGTTANGYCNNQ